MRTYLGMKPVSSTTTSHLRPRNASSCPLQSPSSVSTPGTPENQQGPGRHPTGQRRRDDPACRQPDSRLQQRATRRHDGSGTRGAQPPAARALLRAPRISSSAAMTPATSCGAL